MNLASDPARKPLSPDGGSEESPALDPLAAYRAEPGRPEARADAAACPGGSGRARPALARVMWASLAVVPAVPIAQVLRMGGPVLFVGSVVAMVPLAWLIGEATDQAAERTGPVAAALLNASFGNAPELIITLFAAARGLGDVVRGSLVGSVAGNLLLVLGTALIAERRRSGGGGLAQDEVLRSAGLVAAACVVFTVTTAVGPHRLAPAPKLAAAVVLIGAYALVTVRSLHGTSQPPVAEGESEAVGGSRWPLRRALVVLGGATLATVAMSQVLTASIEPFERAAGIPDLFVAGVVVALAGNAAEHGGAVVIAARGQIRLAGGIAMASATQVGLAVLPAVALASLFFNPLALSFRPVELACLAVTAIAPAILLRDGRTSRRRGAALCTAYAAVVLAFLYSH